MVTRRNGGGATRRVLPFAVPVGWVLGVLAWEYVVPLQANLVPLLAAAPAIACAGTGHRRGVVFGGACALFALYPLDPLSPYGAPPDGSAGSRVGTCAAILCTVGASYRTARRRGRLTTELHRARQVATAAQEVLLRPLPERLAGYAVAAGQLSATRGADVGGDLYDAVVTPYGVRVVMGDVRGHGLAALGTVSTVLGSFREAAHDEPELGGVLRRLERGLARRLQGQREAANAPADAAEDFVTVLLLEARPDGTVTAHNCGHPWPFLLSSRDGAPSGATVAEAEPLPPLGLFPLPAALPQPLRLQLPPGDTLFLHTDGAQDARDAHGANFALPEALRAAVRRRCAPADLVTAVRAALVEHTGGRFNDDAALLALRNDNGPQHAATETQACSGVHQRSRGDAELSSRDGAEPDGSGTDGTGGVRGVPAPAGSPVRGRPHGQP